MQLEKLNENQIRCTLDREDLLTRGLRLSELAYGTEKAKELFRDMMQQASYEFGFETEDLPIMIEAIPASLGRLILVITKVEDPDELDTRFSKFSPDPASQDYYDDSDEREDDLLELLNTQGSGEQDGYMTTSESGVLDPDSHFIPLPECLGLKVSEKNVENRDKPKTTPDRMKVYSFATLSEISMVSQHLVNVYTGENRVYKNPHTGVYYLVLFRSEHTTEEFGRICNFLSEYAHLERTTYATLSHMEEHYELIIRNDAVSILATL